MGSTHQSIVIIEHNLIFAKYFLLPTYIQKIQEPKHQNLINTLLGLLGIGYIQWFDIHVEEGNALYMY